MQYQEELSMTLDHVHEPIILPILLHIQNIKRAQHHNPAANKLAEAFNKTLVKFLKKIVLSSQQD